MSETQINFKLSDHDFAQYLRSMNDRKQLVFSALQWFHKNGTPVSEGLEVVTTALNNARSAFELPVAVGANYSLGQGEFAGYLRGLNDPRLRVSAGLEWFSKNGVGYGDALDVTATVFNNLSSMK